jgi:thiol-disulfide isomerase/thioredoxin
MSRRRIGGIVALIAVGGVFAFGLSQQASVSRVDGGKVVVPPSGFTTFRAPSIAGSTLAGVGFSLGSMRGKPTFINFWQTACTPCEREAPALRAFAAGLGNRAAIVGVAMDSRVSEARRFARRHGWSFPIVPRRCCDLNHGFGVVGYPTTIVLDDQGRVVDRLVGAQTVARLRAELRALGV